jgi:hypothetical protein
MDDLTGAVASSGLESFGRTLVEQVLWLNFWTALLLAGALVADRMLSRRVRASFRIAFYAPVALRVLLPLSWNLPVASGSRIDTFIAPLLQVGARSGADGSASSALSWYALAPLVYVAVAILLAARAVAARVRLARALAEAGPIPGHDFGLAWPVMQHVDLGPMAVGLLAPRIVVPRDLLGEENEHALACVLRHEIAHLRRRDAWSSTAMLVLGIVAWPVVPVWIAIARVHQLLELACDEKALDGADAMERRRYGHALLELAESRSFAVAPLGSGELHFGSTLRVRVEALVGQHHWPLPVQVFALAFAPVALFVACGGSTAPSSTPPTRLFVGVPTDYGYEFAANRAESDGAPAPSPAPPIGPEGRLIPEAIEGVVRVNFGDIVSCYEAGQRKNAKLAGQVTVKYAIGEDGSTKEATDERSTLPDRDVVDCVVRAFRQFRYPASRGGNIAVVYPIQFGS